MGVFDQYWEGSAGVVGWVLAAAFALTGCDHAAVPTQPQPRAASTAPTDLQVKPPPRRGRLIGGEKVARRVAWPDGLDPATPSVARLDADTLTTSPVPVLVPPEFDGEPTLATGETWYAFAGRLDGVEIMLQGSASSTIVPGIRAVEPTHAIRQQPGFVSRNEGIWSVSWTEHGAAYSLEIGCADPYAPPCDDEAFALSWVDELVVAGGREVSQ